MAFLKIEDEFGTYDCVIFAKVFEAVNGYITDNQIVFCKGRVKIENDDDGQVVERKVIINEINDISILYDNAKEKVDKYNDRVNSIISRDDSGDFEEPF